LGGKWGHYKGGAPFLLLRGGGKGGRVKERRKKKDSIGNEGKKATTNRTQEETELDPAWRKKNLEPREDPR